jgi:hypothetical protein
MAVPGEALSQRRADLIPFGEQFGRGFVERGELGIVISLMHPKELKHYDALRLEGGLLGTYRNAGFETRHFPWMIPLIGRNLSSYRSLRKWSGFKGRLSMLSMNYRSRYCFTAAPELIGLHQWPRSLLRRDQPKED